MSKTWWILFLMWLVLTVVSCVSLSAAHSGHPFWL